MPDYEDYKIFYLEKELKDVYETEVIECVGLEYFKVKFLSDFGQVMIICSNSDDFRFENKEKKWKIMEH